MLFIIGLIIVFISLFIAAISFYRFYKNGFIPAKYVRSEDDLKLKESKSVFGEMTEITSKKSILSHS